MFIIGTIIPFVTFSKILSVFPAMNTWPITEQICPMNRARRQGIGWSSFARLQANGTEAKPGAPGIANSESYHGLIENLSNMFASIARRSLKVSNAAKLDFALETARPDGTITMPHMGKIENVSFVIPNTLSRISTRNKGIVLVGVDSIPEKRVAYNLQVDNPDGEGEYFANGVLVHNCDALRYWCFVRGRG